MVWKKRFQPFPASLFHEKDRNSFGKDCNQRIELVYKRQRI